MGKQQKYKLSKKKNACMCDFTIADRCVVASLTFASLLSSGKQYIKLR